MIRYVFRNKLLAATVIGVTAVSSLLAGCGQLADPNQIIIAELQGEPVRRADIKKVLRDMTDEERPLIQSRDDLLVALKAHLDGRIKADVAKKLRESGSLEVPREMAAQVYFSKHPEFRNLDKVDDPSAMNVSEAELAALQAEVEFGIDDELDKLYADAAVQYKVQEYITNRTGTITEEELREEFESIKARPMTFEVIEFDALRFGTVTEAADMRRRIDAGEEFVKVLETQFAIAPNSIQRSAFENDPSNAKFTKFWYTVTGCSKGDIFGPILLPEHDAMRPGPNGQPERMRMPTAYVVMEIQNQIPAREKTFEEAQQELIYPIITRRVMDALREEYGLEIYEDKLYRPEGYGDQYKDSMIKTNFTE